MGKGTLGQTCAWDERYDDLGGCWVHKGVAGGAPDVLSPQHPCYASSYCVYSRLFTLINEAARRAKQVPLLRTPQPPATLAACPASGQRAPTAPPLPRGPPQATSNEPWASGSPLPHASTISRRQVADVLVVSAFADVDALYDKIGRAGDIAVHVDAWTAQVYRGKTFGDFFATMGNATDKPVLLTEYGVDAYHDACGTNDDDPCYNTFEDTVTSTSDKTLSYEVRAPARAISCCGAHLCCRHLTCRRLHCCLAASCLHAHRTPRASPAPRLRRTARRRWSMRRR